MKKIHTKTVTVKGKQIKCYSYQLSDSDKQYINKLIDKGLF